jgi:hypothetical protein
MNSVIAKQNARKRRCGAEGAGRIEIQKADANGSKTNPLVTPVPHDFRPRQTFIQSGGPNARSITKRKIAKYGR